MDLPTNSLDQFDNYIFDCDGVIWRGSKLIDKSIEVIQKLIKEKKNVFFVTNNSTLSRKSYADKFEKKGFKNITKENILCSSFAAARYLSLNHFKGKVFVIGEKGIHDELQEHNIPFTNEIHDEEIEQGALTPPIQLDPEVKAVIVGFDRKFNYLKMGYAYRYLTCNDNCLFIATNTDKTFPSSNGFMPGTGSIITSIETASGMKPIVTGKPSPILMDVVKSKITNMNLSKTLMIGDRLETDILFGNNAGINTLLVLTGISTRDMVNNSTIKPTYIANSIAELID